MITAKLHVDHIADLWHLNHIPPIINSNFVQDRPVGSGGAGGIQPPNNSLKFADFVSEMSCKIECPGNELLNSNIFKEGTRIYQNAISFDIIQLKNFKIFLEGLPSDMILCVHQWQIFQKWGVFQWSKGRGHGKFSRGQAPRPRFLLALLVPCFSPPPLQYEFCSDRPAG